MIRQMRGIDDHSELCEEWTMEKKAVILSTAAELRQARSQQRSISSEELVAQRRRHRLASEAFAADAKNAISKAGRVKLAVG